MSYTLEPGDTDRHGKTYVFPPERRYISEVSHIGYRMVPVKTIEVIKLPNEEDWQYKFKTSPDGEKVMVVF